MGPSDATRAPGQGRPEDHNRRRYRSAARGVLQLRTVRRSSLRHLALLGLALLVAAVWMLAAALWRWILR